ncbi:MAG: hypothetical protein E6I39_08765 [Chloroflexi bacterium]|nr:MAG: hypothetical protein E6I98_11840 [Chloroflexota bacterium]TME98998.1 MAG: hypothetical protein E6I39_08765 [Chloroflexota bacterium]
MLSLVVDGASASGRRRRKDKARATLARALASLCEVCGGTLAGGAILYGPVSYCSFECADTVRHRFVAGNYLG